MRNKLALYQEMIGEFFVHRSESDNIIVGGGYSLQESTEQTGGKKEKEKEKDDLSFWALPAGLAVFGSVDNDSFNYEADNDVPDVAHDSYFGGNEEAKPSFTESRKKRNRKKGTRRKKK